MTADTVDSALRHDALVYGADDEFLAALLPFVTEGLEQGHAVVAVTTPDNVALLERSLAARGGSVEFIDARDWYQTPARTIAGYRAKLDDALGAGAAGVRVIGEVAFGEHEATHREWVRYESVLNHVFADVPAWIVCPYDRRRLPPAVIDEAARTHPHLYGAEGRRRSEVYAPPEDVLRRLPPPAEGPPPSGAARSTVESGGDLRAARAWLRRQATEAGLRAERLEELLLAVSEVVANGLVHGRPPVRLWVWRSGGTVNVRVADSGAGIPDPLVGFSPPQIDDPAEGGMGLWLARQLCRAVEVLPQGGGANVHLAVAV